MLIDSAFAFDLPDVSAGWIEIVDVETGQARTISRRALPRARRRAREWQDDVRRSWRRISDLDVVTIGLDQAQVDIALSEFVVGAALRKTND